MPRHYPVYHGDPTLLRFLVTFVYCIHVAEDIVKLLSGPGSPSILVFSDPRAGAQFQGEPLQRERKIYTRGGKNLRFSTEIAVYLGSGTR